MSNNIDPTFASIVTGKDCWGGNPIKQAVAQRAAELIPTFQKRNARDHGGLGYCYDGYRCAPENLGWRLQQNSRAMVRQLAGDGPGEDIEVTVEKVLAGDLDDLIEYTWHSAAQAEYWYRFEKEWD